MEKLIGAMKHSISDVLGTMFFLPVDFPAEGSGEAPWKPGSGETVVARLGFRGPLSGTFHFFIPKELTVSLTAGFLGQDESEVTADHVADMVKEIVNMIAGNTFSILDDQAVFDLGIPELIESRSHEIATDSGQGSIFIPIRTIDNSLALQLELLS